MNRRERVRALAEALAELVADEPAAPSFPWVRWSEWARSPEHARRIAAREGVELTRIGRDLYGRREHLDALAERNRVRVDVAANDGVDDEVVRAFASGDRR